MVGSWPMKRKGKIHEMIIIFVFLATNNTISNKQLSGWYYYITQH